jgi:hypothetical protein
MWVDHEVQTLLYLEGTTAHGAVIQRTAIGERRVVERAWSDLGDGS